MFTETPIDANGNSPDIMSQDGKNLYRLYLHSHEIRIRTKEGGWAKFHHEDKENQLRQLWLRMAYEGNLVHLNADGSVTPWQGRGAEMVVSESASAATFGGASEADVAAALSAQYRKANLATFEIVKFGAMVLAIEEALEGPKAGRGSVGIKGWIEAHCPEIQYRTSMRHKEVAKAIFRQYTKADPERTIEAFASALQLEGNADATADDMECSEAVKELVFGKSARQLLFDFAGRKSGRPEGSKNEPTPRKLMSVAENEELATIELEDIVQLLGKFVSQHKHLLVLNVARRNACRMHLQDVANLLK